MICEARVRYLSFLGIGKNVKNCAFIVHTAQDKFIAHVFRCEPSSGALCKTIEAACKVSTITKNKSKFFIKLNFLKNKIKIFRAFLRAFNFSFSI